MKVIFILSMLQDVGIIRIYEGVNAFFIADLARLMVVVFSPITVLWLVKSLE